MKFVYETNPIDESCDQRIKMITQALVVSYDDWTFRQISNLFQSKEIAQLRQINSAAKETLQAFNNASSLGLEYAIKTHTVLNLDIKMKGSLIQNSMRFIGILN